MKKKSLVMLLTAAMMLTGLTACGKQNTSGSSESDSSEDKAVTIKLGFTHSNPDREVDDEVMYAETFKEYVESKCDSIKVELYPGSALGSQADTVGAVASGTVQMTIQNSSQLNNYDESSLIFGMPGIFTDIEETNKVVDSDWAEEILEDIAKNTGIRVLGNSCTGMRSFTCKGRELRTVEDAKGLTFRIPESAIYTEMVEAISVVIDKTYEVQDWYVLDNHTPTVMSYMINDEFYNGLSENQKAVIDEANEEATKKARAVTEKLEASGIATLEENGMTVYIPTEEELKGWHDAYGPVCEKYMREEVGDELVDSLLDLLAEIRG